MAEKDGAWIGDAKGIAGVDINQNQHYLKCDTNGVLDVNATITSIFGPIDVIVDNIVPVTQSGSWTVAVNNFPATQPVSGTVTVLQGTSPWITSVSNFPAVQTVNVNNFPATQPVSGTVAVSNFPATQAVSAVSLPLPTGAATAANQTNGTQVTQTIPLDGNKATYSGGFASLAVAAAATDIFTITGSATKTIRIVSITTTATQTAGGTIILRADKRSTANSGGTSTTVTSAPHDSNDAAATATVLAYTANPTVGTLAAVIRAQYMYVNAAASGASSVITWTFGSLPAKEVVLRGTSQVLAIHLAGQTVVGGNFTFYIEWTEE